MHLNRIKKIVIVNLFCFFSSFLIAQKLTSEQKNELFQKGRITVENGYYEVNFIEGNENVIESGLTSRQEALELLGEILEFRTYFESNFLAPVKLGFKSIGSNSLESYRNLEGAFKATRTTNKGIKPQFGRKVLVLQNWFKFSKSIANEFFLLTAANFQSFWTFSSSFMGSFVYQPLDSGRKFFIEGAIEPSIKLSWNGLSWYLSKEGELPKEGDVSITFVSKKDN